MLEEISRKKFSIGSLYCINETEAQVLINEIFNSHVYLHGGLTLNPGAVIFDIGANIGIFSLYALYKCHYDASIYSFEPIPNSFECLNRNLNPYQKKVFLFNVGISNVEKDCLVDFTRFGNSFATATYRPQDKIIANYEPLLRYETLLKIAYHWNKLFYYKLKYLPFMRNYLIKKNYNKLTIETKVRCHLTSLGKFIEKHQIDHIDYLKIDVEGAEFDVIKSIKPEQFSLIQQICIEAHDINNRVEQLVHYLERYDYTIDVVSNPICALGFNHHMLYVKKKS